MGSHHHVAPNNLIHFAALRDQFGDPTQQDPNERHDILGDRYTRLVAELSLITEHQWRSDAKRGLIKGFLLSGPPGTGKTTLAKRVAYELGRRFNGEDESDVIMAFVDGGEVSRSRYGESEERIIDLFAHAKAGFTKAGQRSVILFDDVESIFMARGAEHVKEWHFSQDSVFFHAIDELDTSRSVIMLTSNRPDLVDDAIRDRFLTYRVDYPDRDTLVEIAANIAARQMIPEDRRAGLEKRVRDAAASGGIRSLRDVQRFVVQDYVGGLLGGTSLAETGNRP